MFGAQQQYSQQLSAQMPQAYGQGLGAVGFGGGFQPGGGFGYSPGGGMGSYGPGNSFGNTMTSAVGGIGNAVGGASKWIGGLAGGVMGSAFGPIGGFMGSALGSLPGAAIQHVSGAFAQGAQEQSSIERTLSQFHFQNAGSRTGQGFDRNSSMAIGNMVRQMERIPEMLTSFGELNRVMDKMGQMGMMQGVRDAGEFQRKFKDMVGTLKDISKIMGGTMEDALQMVGESRRSGFYSGTDIARNALNRRMTSNVTGMSQEQVAGLQMYGAEMGHAMGGSRRTGAMNMTRSAAQLGMMNQMGLLSNDDIMEMTGKEGAAGIQDLAGSMGQLSYRMSQGNVGSALTMALGAVDDDGRFTGKMDQGLVEKVRRGQISLSELKRLARSKTHTRGSKLSFSAHRSRLTAEMAGSVGAEGVAMQLQEILGERGWQNPDAQNLVMQRFGASEEQANLLQKLMPNLQNVGAQLASAGEQERKTSARNAAMQEHGWDAIKHRIGKRIEHHTTDWAKDLGVHVRNYFQNWADDFIDDLTGHYSTNVTKRVSDAIKFGGSSYGRVKAQAAGISGVGGMRLDVGRSGGLSGAAARMMHSLDGSQTQGERMDSLLHKTFGNEYLHHSGGGYLDAVGRLVMGASGPMSAFATGFRKGGGGAGNRITLDSSFSGRESWTTEEEMRKASARLQSGTFGKDELAQLQGVLGSGDISGLLRSYQKAAMSGDITQETDEAKRADMIWEELRKTNSAGLNGIEKSWDRGGAGVSALGKALKGGLTQNKVIAALQHMSESQGAKLGGRVNWADASNSLGVNFTTASLSAKRAKAEKTLMGIDGGAHGLSGSEVKGILDQGGNMSNLAQGLFQESSVNMLNLTGGSIDALQRAVSTGSVKGMSAEEIKKVWAADPAISRALKAAGVDADELATDLTQTEKREQINKLVETAKRNKSASSAARDYVGSSSAEGLARSQENYHAEGNALAKRLKGIDPSKLSDKDKKAYDLLMKRAKGLQGVDIPNGIDFSGSDSSELAAALQGSSLSDVAGAGFGAVMGQRSQYAQGLSGLLKKRGGAGMGDVVKALHLEGAPDDFKKEIEGKLGSNKKLDKGEIEEILKIMTASEDRGNLNKPGSESGSTTVSDQDVIKAFKDMSDNNVKITTILGNLASGKTGEHLGDSIPMTTPK